VFLADYTGTAPVVGTTYGCDATGLLIDGDNTSGGEAVCISTDTVKTKCRVAFVI